MWISDDDKKRSILDNKGDIIVSAGAGSGKTTLLVTKMDVELENIKEHYGIAAITFTNKAAKLLLSRIGKYDYFRNFVGTSDSFVESEILKPFIKDAKGKDYPSEYKVDYRESFSSFEAGLDKLKYDSILGVFDNSQRNRKKNFKFRLAIDVLRNSLAARQYLKAKYKWILIDEYQDTDRDMNRLYMYLRLKLKIKLFLVGDLKQSIYVWRGAEPENFKDLLDEESGFSTYELFDNHRCCVDVQNYAHLFSVDYPYPLSITEPITGVIGIKSRSNNYDMITLIDSGQLDLSREVAILVRTRNQAQRIREDLLALGFDFTFIPSTPLDSLPNSNFLKELMTYIKDTNYTFYDLRNELPLDINNIDMINFKKLILKFRLTKDKKELEGLFVELYGRLGFVHYNDEFESFFEVINTNLYDAAFQIKSALHSVMTIHSAKGLEYDQVVLYSGDFRFEDDISNEHYVAVTRAKEKLIILRNNYLYEKRLSKLMKEKQVREIIKEVIVN